MARRNYQALRFNWQAEIKRLAGSGDMVGLDELLEFMKSHITQIGVFERQWVGIINGASARGVEFKLSIEEALDIFRKQGGRCALSGLPIDFNEHAIGPGRRSFGTASLDRIRSDLGYAINNVWWVHRDINRMKLDLSPERFIELCRAVTANADIVTVPVAETMPAIEYFGDITATADAALLVQKFLRDCTTADKYHSERAKDLWDRFNAWRADEGLPPCGPTAFGRGLSHLGFRKSKGHFIRWLGLRLTPVPAARESRESEASHPLH